MGGCFVGFRSTSCKPKEKMKSDKTSDVSGLLPQTKNPTNAMIQDSESSGKNYIPSSGTEDQLNNEITREVSDHFSFAVTPQGTSSQDLALTSRQSIELETPKPSPSLNDEELIMRKQWSKKSDQISDRARSSMTPDLDYTESDLTRIGRYDSSDSRPGRQKSLTLVQSQTSNLSDTVITTLMERADGPWDPPWRPAPVATGISQSMKGDEAGAPAAPRGNPGDDQAGPVKRPSKKKNMTDTLDIKNELGAGGTPVFSLSMGGFDKPPLSSKKEKPEYDDGEFDDNVGNVGFNDDAGFDDGGFDDNAGFDDGGFDDNAGFDDGGFDDNVGFDDDVHVGGNDDVDFNGGQNNGGQSSKVDVNCGYDDDMDFNGSSVAFVAPTITDNSTN